MGEHSAIAWTDHTFNPWIGCQHVSPACDHCYAETLRIRTGQNEWATGARTVTSDAYWRHPLRWDRQAAEAGRPALVFCASLADVFEDRPDLEKPRRRLWDLIDQTPHLRWLLLTKRPENIARMVPTPWLDEHHVMSWGGDVVRTLHGWPRNVWPGTTVEDQERALERLDHLLALHAPVRFLSVEPMLGPLNLWPWLWADADNARGATRIPGIDWVICGGESGPGHRPLDIAAARWLRDQCAEAGVPFFFKQVGGATPRAGGDLLDGRQHHAWPAEAHR